MLAHSSLAAQFTSFKIPPYPVLTGLHRAFALHSIGGFVYALAWTWILLVSCNGWGRAAARLLHIKGLPAFVACMTGIAALIFSGGLLNLLHAIYAAVLFALVAVGLVFYLLLRRQRPEKYGWSRFWRQASPGSRLLLTLAALVLIFRVGATVRLGVMNNLDDGPGYLVLPHKMLQVHNFAPDPFSERRVTSSVGGGYLLQSFVIAATSLTNVGMADRTLGLILLGGILFDLGVLFQLSALQIALLEFLAYIVPQETMNLTFVVLPIALLLGMVWLIWHSMETEHTGPSSCALLAGALGGAAISLKSTYLPCVGMFALLPYLFIPGPRTLRLRWKFPLLAMVGAVCVLLAWMVAMWVTSGTALFPVLGRGVDYSSYRLFSSAHAFRASTRWAKIFLQGTALLVLAIIQLMSVHRSEVSGNAEFSAVRRGRFGAAILIAAAIAITAVNLASGGDSIWRYNFPQFFSAILVFFAVSASILRIRPSGITRASYAVAAVCLISMVFYYDAAGKRPQPFREVAMAWGDYLPSLRASLTGLQLENPQVRAEYGAVEDSIKQPGIVLENTAFPFLFDFHRRHIFIADWPGASSPPPGWPFESDSGTLARYLKSHSIRYVIYDYGYGRWMDAEGCEALHSRRLYSEWLLEQWWLSILAHNQFDHLKQDYASVYDDGNIAVVDLAHPVKPALAESSTWTLHTSPQVACSAVMIAYQLPSTTRAGAIAAASHR